MVSYRAIATGLFLLAVLCPISDMPAAHAQSTGDVRLFEVDASWPKPLPNNWQLGPVSGITTDARGHIWRADRGDPGQESGRTPAPPLVEFKPEGSVVQTWGGPASGYEWPQQVHGITVDSQDRVWISGNGDKDAQILKFSRTGTFLLQIGHSGKNGGSNDTLNLGRA